MKFSQWLLSNRTAIFLKEEIWTQDPNIHAGTALCEGGGQVKLARPSPRTISITRSYSKAQERVSLSAQEEPAL